MTSIIVFCTASTESEAVHIVSQLGFDGFPDEDISVLFLDGAYPGCAWTGSSGEDWVLAGVGPDGLLGGTLALLIGINRLAIPGIGAMLAAGPVAVAMVGAPGLASALIVLGIPPIAASTCCRKIRQGDMLISVRVFTRGEATAVKGVFELSGAANVGAGRSTSALKDERRLERTA